MHQTLAKSEAQFIQQDGEHLEVVVLLIAHHIDHLVDGVVVETQLRRTNILGHIDRGTILTEQQLLVQTIFRQVSPYRTILPTVEDTLLQTFQYLCLTLQVGL